MAMRPAVLDQLKVGAGEKFRLADHSPSWLPEHLRDLDKKERKNAAGELLADNVSELAEAQDLLYADDR